MKKFFGKSEGTEVKDLVINTIKQMGLEELDKNLFEMDLEGAAERLIAEATDYETIAVSFGIFRIFVNMRNVAGRSKIDISIDEIGHARTTHRQKKLRFSED